MTTAKSRSTVLCHVAVGALTAIFASVASAAATGDVLEEIVVTAQKREQNVQNVPIAITAFTAETLQSKGLGDIGALTRLTPNVNLDTGSPFSGDTSVLSASIRGIGQDDFAFNLDPGVGVYLDGVYLARTIGANQNLLDIDRIEILKGPQGTLFGRNTIGGAISIVTHTPGTEKKIVATATTGSFNRRDIAASVDMPFSDSFLTTLSVSSQTRERLSKGDSVSGEHRDGPGSVRRRSTDGISEGGLRNLRYQGRPEPAGASRQGTVERVGQGECHFRRRLFTSGPIVLSDHGSRCRRPIRIGHGGLGAGILQPVPQRTGGRARRSERSFRRCQLRRRWKSICGARLVQHGTEWSVRNAWRVPTRERRPATRPGWYGTGWRGLRRWSGPVDGRWRGGQSVERCTAPLLEFCQYADG